MGRLERLLERQAEDLAALQERQVAGVRSVLEEARRRLLAELLVSELEPTTEQLRVQLLQVEAALVELSARMGAVLAGGEFAAGEQALAHLLATVQAAEPNYLGLGSQVEVPVLARLAEERGLALHTYSVRRYAADTLAELQREITVGYARGANVNQLTAALSRVLQGNEPRAETIARMELSRAYDAGASASIRQWAETVPAGEGDAPARKRADEFFDHRNHPFSRLLHGRLADPAGEWSVPVGSVERRGLVWRVEAGVAKGGNYPAHFNDRGRQIPWRETWEL